MLCSSAWSDLSSVVRRSCRAGQVLLVMALATAATSAVAAPVAAPAAAPVAAPAEEARPAAPLTLDDLLGRFARMSGLQAKFREEKRMALLAAPLVNEGVIYFIPGAGKPKLARHTTLPAPSVVLIEGSALRMADGTSREEIALDRNPPVRLFVDSFVKIFAGDREALAGMYAMELAAEADKWTLRLKPKVAPIDKLIDRIEITGEGLVIATMRVVEIGGDETLTTFSAVDPQRRYTPEELAALFSLPPPRR
jgi:hypothetical protein